MSGLSAKVRQDLQTTANSQGLIRLAVHWGLVLVLGILIAKQVPFWWVLLPFQGVLIIFTFTILHECTHRTPFRTLWLNEAVGWISGLIVGLPFLWFGYFHLAHHKFTNNPDKDPELIGHAKPENLRQYLWYVSGVPVWVGQIKGLVRNAFGRGMSEFVPVKRQRHVRIESLITIILYTLMAVYSFTTSAVLFYCWIIPLLLGQPFLRLYLLAEHGRCPPVANMLENSRTTYTFALVRYFSWNMPYHGEHHTAPNVPFHKIPELNGLIKEHLKVTESGYVPFHRRYLSSIRV